MRVTITGATGFVGRHLLEHSLVEGAEVTALGRRPLAEVEVPVQLAAYVAADLMEPEQAEEAVRSSAPDGVFHLAAEASVARSWRQPGQVMNQNLLSTVNLLEAVRKHAPGARVLVACSGEEYGPPERLPVDEDHPLRPRNPYAVSKAAADLAAAFYADAHGVHVVRTRAFNQTGPGQSPTYVVGSLARQIARAEAEGGGEVVTGSLTVRRDFTDVRDAVRAYWLALERGGADVYNVCSGRSVAVGDILAGLMRQTDLDLPSRVDPALLREGEVPDIAGSNEKLRAVTGWQPEIPLDRTLADTLDWWRERTAAGVAQ